MKYDKIFLRKKFLLRRRQKYSEAKKFDFNLIFKLIKKNFGTKKITIAGYYPSDNEVNILQFLKQAFKKKFKIVLPVIKSSRNMSFKLWIYKEPLSVNSFGILEPKNSKIEIIPDLILVPLVAYDRNLNRIGYGKGYYDRSLKKIKKNKNFFLSLGMAYSFQKCDNIPVNKHDVRLNYLFTERGIISSNSKL